MSNMSLTGLQSQHRCCVASVPRCAFGAQVIIAARPAVLPTCDPCSCLLMTQADIEPHEVLDSTCNALAQKVQQQEPGAMDCVQDIFREAASAAEPLLAPA